MTVEIVRQEDPVDHEVEINSFVSFVFATADKEKVDFLVVSGFFDEGAHRSLGICAQDTEVASLGAPYENGTDGHVRRWRPTTPAVSCEDFLEIHLVNLVARQDENLFASSFTEPRQVLAHGVRRPLIPGVILRSQFGSLLRRQDLHEAV